MALNFTGVGNDPGSLNAFMAATDTDYAGLSVNWGPATRDASGGTMKFHSTRINSVSSPQSAAEYLDTTVCQGGYPVVVGVELNPQGIPGHFVVVTGKTGNDFQIADPGFPHTLLSQYNSEFETRGFVADPPGDISELDLAVGDAAEFLVVDPSQRGTGSDPATGQVTEQIPRSVYFRDGLEDDVTGAHPTAVAHFADVFQPSQGLYKITITGLKLGTYTLSTRMFSQDGSPQPERTLVGIAGVGSTSSVSLELSPSPGAVPRVKRLATFAGTLADISNSLQLGLIDNRGIATSLAQEILAAQRAAGLSRGNILAAFEREVKAQAGKHVTAIVVQVLLEDAASLRTQ